VEIRFPFYLHLLEGPDDPFFDRLALFPADFHRFELGMAVSSRGHGCIHAPLLSLGWIAQDPQQIAQGQLAARVRESRARLIESFREAEGTEEEPMNPDAEL
jgi:hypothetical protein